MTPIVLSLLAAGIWFSGRRVGDHSSVISASVRRPSQPALALANPPNARPRRAIAEAPGLGLRALPVLLAALAVLGPVTGSVASVVGAPLAAAGASASGPAIAPAPRRPADEWTCADRRPPRCGTAGRSARRRRARCRGGDRRCSNFGRIGRRSPDYCDLVPTRPRRGRRSSPIRFSEAWPGPRAEVRRAGSGWPGAWNNLLASYERRLGLPRRPGRIARRSGRWRHSVCASFRRSCASGLSRSSLVSRVEHSPICR